MPLQDVLRQVVKNGRAFGIRAALHDVQLRAVNRVVPFEILKGMTASLADADPAMMAADGFEARFATRDELLELAGQPDAAGQLDAAFIDAALARGDDCFALFDRDAIAGFGWYTRRPTAIDGEMELHFDPAWVYMYKGFTRPAYRGRRLHGIGMTMALRWYTERGARGLISYVKSNNLPSLRSVERIGYRPFGDVYVARVGGRVISWATPGCARYQFRVEASSPATATRTSST